MRTKQRLMTILAAWITCLQPLSAQEQALVINEIMTGNVEQYMSPAYNFDGWIELYNHMNTPFPLGGLYLSDDPADLYKWHIPAEMKSVPAKGFLVIWMGSSNLRHTQCTFKLDCDGGSLYLSDASGAVITQADYPASMERAAYARTEDGGSEWAWTATPTPEASNATATYVARQLEAPAVWPDSRLFETARMTVTPEIPEGCTLRYTTDGSLPTETTGRVCVGTFSVTQTQTLRFRLFRDGWLPSPVTSRSYIRKDKDYQLPVVSIISDPAFLYDDEIGIAVVGTNGRPGNHRSEPCNFNMDWDRPVNISYIHPEEGMVLNRDANITMAGAYSRTLTPHNFKIKGNKKYGGNKHLEYPFFEAKPYIRNRTVLLRNGGNDIDCRIKDALVHTLIQTSGIDIDVQSYQPVHEFVNGEYQGVLNIREPSNKHYAYANYGWDDEDIDAFEINIDSAYVQSCGTQEAMDRLHLLSATAYDADSYAEIKELLDIDEFTNYMAMCMYTGRTDWPHNNYKGFRLHDGGRFRMIPNDLDVAFSTTSPFVSFASEQIYHFQYLYDKQTSKTEEIKLVTIFLNLLQNSDFRRRFIDTYSIMGGSVFEPSRCATVIDSLTARVEPMMQLEGRSCLSSANSFRDAIKSRLNTMTTALRSYSPMQLSAVAPQTVRIRSDVDEARLKINGIEVPTRRFNGKLFAPVRLTAVPPAGYVFKGWEIDAADPNAIIAKGAEWNYYDKGPLPPVNWAQDGYSLASWQLGNAPFGYNKDGLSTVISYGSDAANKRPVYYFRKPFFLSSLPGNDEQMLLEYTVDDGFIVYVNGVEAGRYNMPADNTLYYATTNTEGDPDSGTMLLDNSLFHVGKNLIAVEVHNCSATSSDIYWDARLTLASEDHPSVYIYSTDAEIDLPEGNVILTARYKSLSETERKEQQIHPVCINEISGANSIYINDYFKKNDWVELYNTTDTEVDVEGMYLSNNVNQPRLYRITADGTQATTRIPAHGHLLVWCDKLEPLSALHAPFKISADGGTLLLTAADGSWTDSMDYPAHDGTCTVGRYPDGGREVWLMTTPSIAKSNVLSSYSEYLHDTATTVEPSQIVTAHTLRMNYAGGQISVRASHDGHIALRVYTTGGQQVASGTLMLHQGFGAWPVGNLPAGLYVARAIDESGKSVSCKFVQGR